jgi:hypothetical protein
MGKMGVIVLLGSVAILAAGRADAQSVPDLKGTWSGNPQAIVDGPANHHPPGADGTKPAAKYRLSEPTFTLTIEGQDGRRFWGTTASPMKTERIIGSLSVDGKSIHIVDEDGFLDGTVVDANTLDLCYRHITPASAVVACDRARRK